MRNEGKTLPGKVVLYTPTLEKSQEWVIKTRRASVMVGEEWES